MAKTFFVRLKPYNLRRGCLVRNYQYRGIRFTNRWKEVSEAKAIELEPLIQPHDEEAEIPLFDIKSKDEAMVIEADERDDASGKPTAKVTKAERVPDRKFREEPKGPTVDEDTGEIVEADDVEPAEVIDAAPASEPEPAPKVRSGKKSRSRRSSK